MGASEKNWQCVTRDLKVALIAEVMLARTYRSEGTMDVPAQLIMAPTSLESNPTRWQATLISLKKEILLASDCTGVG